MVPMMPPFGERIVGSEQAINYSATDISGSSQFRLSPPGYDYALQRQSKIVTDALYHPLTEEKDITKFEGQQL